MKSYTNWHLLGGPIIGFNYKKYQNNRALMELGLIIGDNCKPKYFGTLKLSVQLG